MPRREKPSLVQPYLGQSREIPSTITSHTSKPDVTFACLFEQFEDSQSKIDMNIAAIRAIALLVLTRTDD